MENKMLNNHELSDDHLAQASGGSNGVDTHIYQPLPSGGFEFIFESGELSDDELAQASGGAYTECNRGYTCPSCSSDHIRVFEQNGTLTYFCFACRRGGLLNP